MEYFCANCGISTEDNTHKGTAGDYVLLCSSCNFCMRFYILPSELKTKEEIETIFQNTELTKNQRTGSGNKPFKRKKN